VLEQQPLLRRGRANERIGALELLAAQREAQLAGGELCAHARFGLFPVVERVLVLLVGRIDATVPHDHIAGAVLLRGDHAFERCVVEWMILGLDREPLVAKLGRRSFRHRPRLENAIELETKVVVQALGCMFLHDEQQRSLAVHDRIRRGLGRAVELALRRVDVERSLAVGRSLAHDPELIAGAASRAVVIRRLCTPVI
jgi:hypothetical protein